MATLHYQDIEKNYIAHILKEIYMDKTYEPLLRGKRDITILDIGANIGLFSLYAVQFAAKIVAVEPSSQIFEYLEKNVKHLDNVIPVKGAVGAENGSMELFGSDVNLTMFSSHKTGVHSENSETVQKFGLNTLLDLHSITHVDFMKLDIEGSEFEVLSSREFQKAAPKIDVIMGEIHSWTGRHPQQCIQSLEENGFEVQILSQSPLLFLARKVKNEQ